MPIRIARGGSESETEIETESRRRSEVEDVVSPRSYEMCLEEPGNRKTKEICLIRARDVENKRNVGRIRKG